MDFRHSNRAAGHHGGEQPDGLRMARFSGHEQVGDVADIQATTGCNSNTVVKRVQ